jgi:hypothetical protein
MFNKKSSIIFLLGILLMGVVSATFCCEKTNEDAWCQNVDSEDLCNTSINPITDEGYKTMQALCGATSYCRIGTCIDSNEGTCMPSSKAVCERDGGIWKKESAGEIPECNRGCCIIGSNARFVTQVACNKFAETYGMNTKFQEGITSEAECVLNANPEDKGACVYEVEGAKDCDMTTREECNKKKDEESLTQVTFHEGYLCTSNELGSVCAKTAETQCDDAGDVRLIDSCGNLANIYDSTKINNNDYWEKITEPSCSDGEGNKDSKICGDCDYISGSICSEKGDKQVNYGNYICKNLDCIDYIGRGLELQHPNKSDDFYPRHRESWCGVLGKEGSVGSSYFKLLCLNGEITLDESDSLREEICVQEESEYISGFYHANFRKNYWEISMDGTGGCVDQKNQEDCEDKTLRDCVWISYHDYSYTDNGFLPDNNIGGVCVPEYPPAFRRDNEKKILDGELCENFGSTSVLVTYEKRGVLGDLFGGFKCKENCYADPDSDEYDNFAEKINQICNSLGDCGIKKNYLGVDGKYDYKDLFKKEEYSNGE